MGFRDVNIKYNFNFAYKIEAYTLDGIGSICYGFA